MRDLADLGLREYERSTSTTEVVAGEQIFLDLNDFGFAGADIEYVYWEVPGCAIKKYWGDRKGSQLIKLSEADLQKNPLSFYWVDSGDNRKVRFVAGGRRGSSWLKKDFSVIFNVKAPTLDHFKAAKPNPVSIRAEDGVKVIRFGKLGKEAPGIKWDWQVTMPANSGGWVKDLQTELVRQEEIRLISAKKKKFVRKHPTKAQHEQLDQSLFDKGQEATYSLDHYPPVVLPARVKPGESFRNQATWDSPGTMLEPSVIRSSVDNHFRYYILYKPDKKPDDIGETIWVPLAKAEWFWQAEAEKAKSGWVLKSKEGKVRVKGAPTLEFPIYHSNVNENKWIEVT